MGYSTLINAQVANAFRAVKDLAVPVIFVKKSNASFDFSTGEQGSTATNITTKAVIVKSKKTSKESNMTARQLMFKSKDIGDVSLFDSVQIDNVTWRLGGVIANSGYVTLVTIFKD